MESYLPEVVNSGIQDVAEVWSDLHLVQARPVLHVRLKLSKEEVD